MLGEKNRRNEDSNISSWDPNNNSFQGKPKEHEPEFKDDSDKREKRVRYSDYQLLIIFPIIDVMMKVGKDGVQFKFGIHFRN